MPLVPKRSSHRYTQVLEARHSGQGCRNPASRDGKLWAATGVLVSMSMKLRAGKSPESSTCTADWVNIRPTR